MRKYFVILPAALLAIGGAGFLLWAHTGHEHADYPAAKEFAPNFWFDSEEKYYPTSPLDFYYDKELSEIGGREAKAAYDGLSEEEKLNNFRVFYNIDDSGTELVYQYWLFYVFNEGSINEHYGDWESVFVFVGRDSSNVQKVVGSAHFGTSMVGKSTSANNELKGPKFLPVRILVEKGSHANTPDGNNDGLFDAVNLFNKSKDITNWYNAYGIWTWSLTDKLHGLKVEHDSPHYDLRPIEEITDVFGKKYGADRPLISKEKSPTLGMLPIKIGKSQKYALPLGGNPPSNAWNKKEYTNSEEVLPLTRTRLAGNIGGFFSNAGNFIAAVGTRVASPFTNLFTAQVADTPTDVRGFTPQLRGETPIETPLISLDQIPLAPTRVERGEPLRGETPTPINVTGSDPVTLKTEVVFVSHIVDGDTIELSSGQRVRYIGIDTPELPDSCFAKEATEQNRELVEGKQVVLLKGPTDIDIYGRLLRFVWQDVNLSGTIDSPDIFVNVALVDGGYARSADFGENHAYSHRFEAAGAKAKRERLGLWGDACNPVEESAADISYKPRVLIYEPPHSYAPKSHAPIVSIHNNTTFNSYSDINSEKDGYQIILYGIAERSSLITISQNPTYTATTTEAGDWSAEVTLPNEGANIFNITSKAAAKNTSDLTIITLNRDSIAPTSTIAVAEYSIDSDHFKIQWSTDAQDLSYYEAQYKIVASSAWQTWGNATTSAMEKNYLQATPNTYYFRVRGTDIHQNIGPWQESQGVVIDLYQIVINEIQINDAEFVELYNPTSKQINLKDYYFSYYPSTRVTWSGTSTPYGPELSKKFENNATIPANGYFLIGLDGYPTTGGNPNADWQVYTSKQLSNSKGTVAIFPFDPKSFDSSTTSSQYVYDNRVDAIGWGSGISLYEGVAATTTPAAGQSLTRNINHTDTDNNSVDFTVATSTTPTNSAGATYVPPPPPPPPVSPVWAMYQKDARHSGLATLSGPTWTSSASTSLAWTFEMKKGQNFEGGRSQPVIGPDGVIYATSGEGNVYAINPDGTKKWNKFEPSKNTDGGDGAGWTDASPALSQDGSVVYSVHTDTQNIPNKTILYAIRTSDKVRLWKYSINSNDGFTSPVLDSAGNIYVASKLRLYSISPNSISPNDNLLWEFTPTSQFSSSAVWTRMPAISEEGGVGYIYITANMSNNIGDKYIFKLDINGNEIKKEKLSTAHQLFNGVSINATGTIYTGGHAGSNPSGLYAVNPSDLSQAWFTPLGGNVAGPVPNFDSAGNLYIGTTITQNTGAFHQLNAAGIIQWQFGPESPSAVQYPAVIDGQGRVYVGAKNKFIYALDPNNNGAVIWKYQLADEPRGFAIGNGRVYVVSYDGKVYAFGN